MHCISLQYYHILSLYIYNNMIIITYFTFWKSVYIYSYDDSTYVFKLGLRSESHTETEVASTNSPQDTTTVYYSRRALFYQRTKHSTPPPTI